MGSALESNLTDQGKPTMTQGTDRAQAIQRLDERLRGIEVAMVTTLEPDGSLVSRPMMSQRIPFDGDLWFITRAHNRLVWDVQRHPRVNVTYVDPDTGRFISVAGMAHIVRDRAKVDELWDPNIYTGWFPDGIEDPEVVLVKVSVESAQSWGPPGGRERIEGFTSLA